MGKITGFLEYEREDRDYEPVAERVRHWREFVLPLLDADYVNQAARCMNCGVPYCMGTGSVMPGTPGCPVNNQIPDWNDLVYQGNWDDAARNLHSIDLMVTGFSSMLSVHDASHGAGQTRPVTSGKLLVECRLRAASSQLPW